MISTGAEMPETDTLPSTSGSERRAYAYAPAHSTTTSAATAAAAFNRNLRMSQSLYIADRRAPIVGCTREAAARPAVLRFQLSGFGRRSDSDRAALRARRRP